VAKKVYLAGKIAKNDWRSNYVPSTPIESWTDKWPEVDCGRFIVTGPFFVGCDHGCTHGDEMHAMASRTGCMSQAADGVDSIRYQTTEKCFAAIRRSDAVFAWLDDYTAFGTLVEIGYAVAHEKAIIIGHPPCRNHCDENGMWDRAAGHGAWEPCDCIPRGDMWFASSVAAVRIPALSAVEALNTWLDRIELAHRRTNPKFDSEVERLFWEAHMYAGRPIGDLTPQYETTANGRNYRLDFYSPSRKRAIEVDGLAYHNGQDSFIRDRNRQRDLEMAGVRVLRFAAKEVMRDAADCVRQAAQWAATA
jgi:very-short-patch-repair endonuclease